MTENAQLLIFFIWFVYFLIFCNGNFCCGLNCLDMKIIKYTIKTLTILIYFQK